MSREEFARIHKTYILNTHHYMCDCSGHYYQQYSDDWELIEDGSSTKIEKPTKDTFPTYGGGAGEATINGKTYPAWSDWQEVC